MSEIQYRFKYSDVEIPMSSELQRYMERLVFLNDVEITFRAPENNDSEFDYCLRVGKNTMFHFIYNKDLNQACVKCGNGTVVANEKLKDGDINTSKSNIVQLFKLAERKMLSSRNTMKHMTEDALMKSAPNMRTVVIYTNQMLKLR